MKKCLECGTGNVKRKFCSNECKCKNYYKNNKIRSCQMSYKSQKKRRNKYKEHLVQSKGGKCRICGYCECIAALTFHHMDKNQKAFGIASSSLSLKQIEQEVEKCILVCMRCHMEIEDSLYFPQKPRSVNSNRYALNRNRAIQRKKEFVQSKGGECQNCGYSQCLRALSFHHKNPKEKTFCLDLRSFGNRKPELLQAEIDKCELYCVRCHIELEARIRQGGIEPPTCTL